MGADSRWRRCAVARRSYRDEKVTAVRSRSATQGSGRAVVRGGYSCWARSELQLRGLECVASLVQHKLC